MYYTYILSSVIIIVKFKSKWQNLLRRLHVPYTLRNYFLFTPSPIICMRIPTSPSQVYVGCLNTLRVCIFYMFTSTWCTYTDYVYRLIALCIFVVVIAFKYTIKYRMLCRDVLYIYTKHTFV